MQVIFTQSLCQISARIHSTVPLVGITTVIFTPSHWKISKEIPYTVFVVGINTRTSDLVGINIAPFENIPFPLNYSAKYVSISSQLATNCPSPPESSLATLNISPNERYHHHFFIIITNNITNTIQTPSRPWRRWGTVTTNASAVTRWDSGPVTVARLNTFDDAAVLCSSINSKRGDPIRNGNAWRWLQPNRRAISCIDR